MTKKLSVAVFSLVAVMFFTASSFAQTGLNWDGQTGALLTPFAYTAPSPAKKLGNPEIAFHYLAGGPVVGNQMTLSATEGFGKRFEAGFTTTFDAEGSNSVNVASPKLPGALFDGGFTTIHGKYTLINENSYKTKWVPAIAVGATGRFNDSRVIGAAIPGEYLDYDGVSRTNADFYVVATKLVPVKKVIILLNAGEKVTDGVLLGLAGNAGNKVASADQRWQGNWFAAAGIAFQGPAKSLIVLGSEALQEPHYLQLLGGGATIPTTLSYFARIQPKGKPFNIDVALVQAAGKINPDADVQARARFGMGASYRF
ncbi:MAG: DUF3034 family protein [Acidobacteriota bacterium]|nr:DUF3034 family protein [Acidobacteriota bacterium]